MNPFLGIFFHAVGGFAAGSFYLPIKKIKEWSWESGWIINGFFAWLIAPIFISMITVPETFNILSAIDGNSIFWTYFFGVLWGIGGLTFGMTMRYLGMSLGMALALGLTAAFGTLIPPIYNGQFSELTQSSSGKIVLLGILVCLIGIAICGRAGILKDKELSPEQKKVGIKEFNLKKGVIVALFAGIMSACFAFGMAAGKPIADLALQHDAPVLWQNGPVFIIILLGGLTSNFLWCIGLNIKNKTYKDYTNTATPLKTNYFFAAIAGITWYCQFMFYGMGSTQMGEHDFASWTLHMAFIIFFSTLWGIVTKEWKGASKKTIITLSTGLLVLVAATILIGVGNQLVEH
ncbi:L-rhamnose-H+ transport protein [Jejuia pallidilutea]|uniref:L-rhamnose-H+ transport protein n=1 Tax=Jejuia pallidilutea TaxID=504487 RepID=A0A362WZX9_9FLAO|nr:L-rhamnose/proton symporter RhaT [Jejuia pallidilutea]PQV48839.1 L-rhamnose-H+ transport protein [Jejuia pallidilutea]